MPATFQFQLVTPTGVVFDGLVEQVTAHGPLGEFGVLADHTNFVTSLVPGVVTIRRSDGAIDRYVVTGGLVEVKDGAMTMIADGAESPEALDRGAVDAQERDAESKIASISFYDADYQSAEHALQLARARQQALSLHAPQQ
jgi:F-type H+-transporting ATPase subunit epsilon